VGVLEIPAAAVPLRNTSVAASRIGKVPVLRQGPLSVADTKVTSLEIAISRPFEWVSLILRCTQTSIAGIASAILGRSLSESQTA